MKITSPQLAPYRALLAIALLLAAAFSLLTAGDSARAQTAVPAAPTGLTAPTVAHNSVTLSWDDPGDTSITGYRILRRDPVNQAPGVFSTIVSNTGSAATSYTDGTVAAKTRYVYRVKAINAAGLSGQSNYVNAETPAAPVSPSAPAAPTGLTASSVSHDSVTLSWDDPDDDSITGYRCSGGPVTAKHTGTVRARPSSSPSWTTPAPRRPPTPTPRLRPAPGTSTARRPSTLRD